uniref:CN hydrolase domain-containing protein n=1 Tax=Gopherus evgoodei TaxID=1825980 RepID=A0A8C4VP44_9SAUR
MACSQPYVYIAAFILPVLKACILDSYIAAVYEHLIILSEGTKIPVSPEDALMLMNKNMDVLKGAIRTAALQGAYIIVPPEDGIYSWVFARETVYSYLEDFPDPQRDSLLQCRKPAQRVCCVFLLFLFLIL